MLAGSHNPHKPACRELSAHLPRPSCALPLPELSYSLLPERDQPLLLHALLCSLLDTQQWVRLSGSRNYSPPSPAPFSMPPLPQSPFPLSSILFPFVGSHGSFRWSLLFLRSVQPQQMPSKAGNKAQSPVPQALWLWSSLQL